jgi:hypothetical protein
MMFLFILYVCYDLDSDCSKVIVLYVITPERSEPSSRTFLIGEQPNPWDLLQPQDKMSRHRGAEHRRRYELLGDTSLLSPE